jgi:amidase
MDGTCGNPSRQVVFPVQTIGGLQVSRKVYVPATDSFARWLNIFTNPTGAPITIRFGTSNNLGSDTNTVITATSSGGASPTTADTWVATFQNYSGTTSTDPRIGHVLQGPGVVATPLSSISFVNGSDRPYWGYDLTIPAGATRVIVNFVTGQPSKAAAAAKAASLAGAVLPTAATACMTSLEVAGVANFAASAFGTLAIPSLSTTGLAVLGAALALSAFAVLRKSLV